MSSQDCGPYEPFPLTEVDCLRFPLRQGTKLGRTIYFATGNGDKQRDTFCGVVETPQIASDICRAVNAFYGHKEG